jgi:multiple sugar transport system permease protein
VWQGLVNSAIISIGTTLLTITIALPAAYALAKLRLRFVGAALMLFLIVQMIPSINLALPMFSIFSGARLINSYVGLILANASLSIPLAITIMRPYFLSVPDEIVEAAHVDGCGHLSAFWRVVLPITVPGIITIGAVTFVGAWAEYVFALSLNTDSAIQPITVVLADLSYYTGVRWNDLMAVSVVAAVPVVIAFVFFQRHIVSGLTAGATKG